MAPRLTAMQNFVLHSTAGEQLQDLLEQRLNSLWVDRRTGAAVAPGATVRSLEAL